MKLPGYILIMFALMILPVAACGTNGGEAVPHEHDESHDTHSHEGENAADTHEDHQEGDHDLSLIHI